MSQVARPQATKYEVRQIEATHDGIGWSWNQSWHLGYFYTRSDNVGQALTRFLKKEKGITSKRGRTRIEEYWPYTEILDRKDQEPLFAAIAEEK
jgi:hypothetical protein